MDTVDRWTARIFIGQHDDFTSAEARLTTRDTTWLRGTGIKSRDLDAPRTTEADEEIAVGRALIDLGRRLLNGAAPESEPAGPQRPRPAADCPA